MMGRAARFESVDNRVLRGGDFRDAQVGVGWGRLQRLRIMIEAVNESLRRAKCPVGLDDDICDRLKNVAISFGQVGWEMAARALHKPVKRAWKDTNRPLLRPSAWVGTCLKDGFEREWGVTHERHAPVPAEVCVDYIK